MTVPLCALVILDGWGIAPAGPGNAVELAETPVFDALWERYPHATLAASGPAVGLPDGQMGNSEVGHLTIGSGRLLLQDLVRVSQAIEDGSFFENDALLGAFHRAAARGGDVHLIGLVSYGGVHSHIDHLRALLELAEREGMEERTWIHALTDGRDVSPHAAVRDLAELPADRIATVCGRYYAMDRDQRWERTDRAVNVIRLGEGRTAPDAVAAVEASYADGVTDEFVEPTVIGSPGAHPIADGDVAIFFNFRPDRARQLSQRLLEAGVDLTTMTRYRDDFACPVAFEEQVVENTLARGARGERSAPASRRGDGEVRARHVLLQRRSREGVGGGDADPRPLAARRRELRPEAGDVGVRGGGALRHRDRRRLPVRGRELREPGHGGPHGLDPRGRESGGSGRPVPRRPSSKPSRPRAGSVW